MIVYVFVAFMDIKHTHLTHKCVVELIRITQLYNQKNYSIKFECFGRKYLHSLQSPPT